MHLKLNRRYLSISVLVIAILIVIYLPVFRWMINSWLSSDFYSHGFLVPLISAFLIWTKRDNLKNRLPSNTGIVLITIAAIFYILGLLLQNWELGSVSLVLILFGLALLVFGVKATKAIWFPLTFLVFMIPFGFIQDLAYNLEYISVQWSSSIIALLALPVTTFGANVYIGNMTFTVGLVCSGINTLVALLALCAFYVYILKGSVYKRLGIFAISIPLAIGANILRIVSIILVAYFYNVDTATGWYHDVSSPIFFFLAFGILILIAWATRCTLNYDFLAKQPAAK
jgi:exosortase